MANQNAYRDANDVPSLIVVDDTTGETVRLKTDANGNLLVAGAITSGVTGPVSSTDNAVTRWDGVAGTTVQNSVVLIGDTGNVTGLGTLNTLTIPASNFVGLTDSQILTNKTLTSPVLTTPSLGVATATSVNKVAITAPATSATLTLADSSSLVTSGANSLTLTTTGATNVTLPTSGTLVNSAVTTLSSLVTVGTITTGTWDATTIAVNAGGTGVETFTDAGVLLGNGTGAIQVTTAGTAGQVLTSNGAGVDPTFQAAAGGLDRWNFSLTGENTTNSGVAMAVDTPTYSVTVSADGQESVRYASTGAAVTTWTIFNKNPRFNGFGRITSGSTTGNGSFWMGFNTATVPTQTQTAKCAVFLVRTAAGVATIYAVSSDGVTNQNTTVTGVTLTDLNVWEIEVTSTAALFYVNGVLKATNSTKWPAGAPTSGEWASYGVKNDVGDTTSRTVRFGYVSVSMDAAT